VCGVEAIDGALPGARYDAQAAQAYVLERGYTSVPIPLDTFRKEVTDANDPEADVELNARSEASVRFNTVLGRAVGIRRVFEGGRGWWAVVFPLTDDYLKEHPRSAGKGREVLLQADGTNPYVSEFEGDISRIEELCRK
jgi:hypothetical protein